MNAREEVEQLAQRHRNKVAGWFLLMLFGGPLLMHLGEWAASKHSWEGQVIYFVFYGAGGLMLLASLFFGAALWGWFKLYRGALEASDFYTRDPDAFKHAYREVVGPIPWSSHAKK